MHKQTPEKSEEQLRQQIIDAFNAGDVRPAPTEDDIIPMDRFIQDVNAGGFIDYDGFGHLVLDDKISYNTYTHISNDAFLIENTDSDLIVPFSVLLDLFGDRVKVAWYNK